MAGMEATRITSSDIKTFFIDKLVVDQILMSGEM
jgi:hypothetical protein